MTNNYKYKQDFLPRETVDFDLKKTGVFITDPQNDFISEGGGGWPLVGEGVKAGKVVEKLIRLRETAKEVGIRTFYSPHMYTEMDYKDWTPDELNAIDKVMFQQNMFRQGTWGHEYHKDMQPDDNTIQLGSHKGLSNFWTGDAAIQLRARGVDTIVLAGMSCNMCVESHARDAVENGFRVVIVADATAGAGPHSMSAALTNYEFLTNEVVNTDQVIKRLRAAKEKGGPGRFA